MPNECRYRCPTSSASSSRSSGSCGQQPVHQRHRALVQRAGRLAVGVALDPPVGRIRRVAVMPASRSAREFTQAPCPSRLGRNAGRSGTTPSRPAAVGVPPGNADIDQPPPRTHSSSGCAAAYSRDARRGSPRGRVVGEVAAQQVEAAPDRVHVRVLEPRHEQSARRGRPPRCRARSARARRAADGDDPAVRTATARARARAASAVKTGPPVKTRSAWVHGRCSFGLRVAGS